MKLRAYLGSALLVGLLATSPALAQQSRDEGDRNRRTQSEDRQPSGDRQQTQTREGDRGARQQERRGSVSGQVIRTKKVGIRNHSLEHLVVLLRTDRRRLAIVDLGPVRQISDARISSGDRLSANGRVARVGDRYTLMADQIRKDGRTIEIDRRRRTSGRQVQAAFRGEEGRTRREATGQGRVVRTKKVGLRGRPLEHLVALVRTDQGDIRVVDLGPVRNLQEVKLATGDAIVVSGEVVRVGDRQVLMASRLRKDGRETRIDRQQPRSRRDRGESQARSPQRDRETDRGGSRYR